MLEISVFFCKLQTFLAKLAFKVFDLVFKVVVLVLEACELVDDLVRGVLFVVLQFLALLRIVL